MTKLSPLTVSGIKLQLVRQESPEEKPKRYTRIDPVYVCPACGDQHDREDDAIDCCQQDEEQAESGRDVCPVCGNQSNGVFAAAECCLWKDTSPAERFEIATLVERGSPWIEAIAQVTKTEPIKSH